MNEWAKIENACVVEVIVADSEFISSLEGTWVVCVGKVGVGFLYENGEFTNPFIPQQPEEGVI